MKNIPFSLVLLVCLVSLKIQAGTVSGRVIDAADSTALSQCTVKLLAARDSSFIRGTTSDDNGFFKVHDVSGGRYIVQISYIGYNAVNKRVKVTDSTPDVKLGTISVGENTVMLGETTVVGKKTEIKVMEDTIEYNADSYKVQPNAVVEDLLKRLPGVEVSTDGKITSGGKEIKKILIDGKEFFSDDPKVASKNIPVDIVDKLQVVDRKSDLARMTGVDDGEDETVINLSVKKGMNNGWFGNVQGGYGTDKRYTFGAMINRFWNGNQFTILGSGNNTNQLGFTDGNSSRFRQFGGDNGINTSQNVGVNFNVGKGDTFRVGGDVMYSHSSKDVQTRLNRQYLYPDYTSYYNSNKSSLDKSHNIRGDFRLKWDINPNNTFEFRPNFSVNINNSSSTSTSETTTGGTPSAVTNSSKNINSSDGKSYEFGGELVYNHKFTQRLGRAFSAQVKYNLSNVKEKEDAWSYSKFHLDESQDIATDQYIDMHNWSNEVRTRLTWTEPLGDPLKTRYLVLSYKFNYKWNNTDKFVYDRPVNEGNIIDGSLNPVYLSAETTRQLYSIWGPAVLYDATLLNNLLEEGETLNEKLSNSFRNNYFSQSLQAGFKVVRPAYNFEVGASLVPSMSKSINLTNSAKTIPTRWVWNVAPYLNYRYKINKRSSFQADYRAKTSQPSMTQLQPVADETNPLNIVTGNPNLKPTFNNYFNLRYNDYQIESQRSIMAMVRTQFASNSIISVTTTDKSTGKQKTTYDNVNGVWNVMGACMVSMPFRNKKFQFTNNLFGRYNVNKGYINSTFNTSGSLSFNESAGIAFRTDIFDVELRPNYGIQLTTNTVQSASSSTVHNYGCTFYGNYYLPFGLNLNTDLTYTDSKGYAKGFNNEQWIWNASLSYQFLKGKAATLSVKGYDLLGQKSNISRSTTANYIQDQEYNNLNRYFMVTFAYTFNTFGSKNKPENKYQDFNREGRHGGPGHGPGPGGPGPRR